MNLKPQNNLQNLTILILNVQQTFLWIYILFFFLTPTSKTYEELCIIILNLFSSKKTLSTFIKKKKNYNVYN